MEHRKQMPFLSPATNYRHRTTFVPRALQIHERRRLSLLNIAPKQLKLGVRGEHVTKITDINFQNVFFNQQGCPKMFQMKTHNSLTEEEERHNIKIMTWNQFLN